MSLLKIPGYFYFGTETIQSSLNFYKSTTLYNKALAGEISYVVRDSAANAIVNPIAYANDYLGEMVISPNIENINIALLTGETVGTWVKTILDRCSITPTTAMHPANNTNQITKFVTLNSHEFSGSSLVPLVACGRRVGGTHYSYNLSAYSLAKLTLQDMTTEFDVTIEIPIWPDDMFVNNVINPDIGDTIPKIRVSMAFATDLSTLLILRIESTTSASLKDQFNGFTLQGSGSEEKDTDNPYPGGDDDNPPGDYGDPKETDPTPVPDLPTLGASDFVTLYGPSSATLASLAAFLWSANTIFDMNNFKKLYSDPSECLIGLSIVPCVPTATGTKDIMFGNIDTDIACTYYTKQWVEVDCGSLYIKTIANSFMDYSPYVKIQLFLPYIGFVSLDPDEVMGKTISVVYHVDIVSGDLVAFISATGKGVIYSYAGNCLCNVPVTGSSFGAFWNKYYSQLAQVVPNMGGGAMQGGAAGAAAGGLNTLFNTAESVMFDRKPTYSRSGSMSGSAAIMGVQKPFIIIERPNISVPEYVQNYAGLSANKTLSLGGCSGFTQVDYVHIEGVTATADEIAEIERLLRGGVIL